MGVGASDRSDAADLVSRFQRAFDRQDWEGLAACLAPQVRVDYRDLRRSPAGLESASDYCQRGDLRICAITQEVLRNSGDPDIHLGAGLR